MNKLAHKSTPPKENIQSMTTPSDPWLSWYLVVDWLLGTLQALVHIVIVNCLKTFSDRTNLQKSNTTKIFHANNLLINGIPIRQSKSKG